jgi:hypothetical protein
MKDRTDFMTRGYYKSKHIQLLKVGMLIALSESVQLKLTKEHLGISLELLDKLEVNLPKVFEGMGRNELAPVAARVVEMLEMVGQPVNEKKVVADFFKDADTREIYGILAHLQSTGKIVYIEDKDQTGRVIRRRIATPQIGQAAVDSQQHGSTEGSPEKS